MFYYWAEQRGLKCTSAAYSLTKDRQKAAQHSGKALSWPGNAAPRFLLSVLADYDTLLSTEADLAGTSVQIEVDFTEILTRVLPD